MSCSWPDCDCEHGAHFKSCCDRMRKAEQALRDIRDLATTAGYSAKQSAAIARAALSSEDAPRPTGGET